MFVDYNNNVKNEKSLWNRFILTKLWIFVRTRRRIISKNLGSWDKKTQKSQEDIRKKWHKQTVSIIILKKN